MDTKNRIYKRGDDLLDIIKLNKFGFSNCDIPPINYDIFIRSFGVKYSKQVDCQTVVLKNTGIQTDCVAIINKWTQSPPVMKREFGNDVIEQSEFKTRIQHVDPFILNNFLLKTEIVMSIVIKSEHNDEHNNSIIPSGAQSFSKFYSTIKCLQICKKSAINYIFSNKLHLFCVQNVAFVDSAEKSLISVWNLLILGSKPEKLLICRSHISCAISDHNSLLVIAALIDGSIALWDTEEPSHYHKKLMVDQNNAFILRTPSYNSAVTGKGHNTTIISIDQISSQHEVADNNGLFQFSTIDQNGLFIIWTITATKDASNDCGISPVSNWTLMRNSFHYTMKDYNDGRNAKITSFQCPYDCSYFYCGTDTGVVIRCATHHHHHQHYEHDNTNFALKLFLRSGIFNSNKLLVTTIKFNEISATNALFLVGYSDGIIAYFSTDKEESLFTFDTNNYSIRSIQWFSNANQTFIALNNNNEIFIFDLKSNLMKCLIYYKHIHSGNRLISFTLCEGFHSFLIFGTNCGNCEVFALIDKLSLRQSKSIKHLLIN